MQQDPGWVRHAKLHRTAAGRGGATGSRDTKEAVQTRLQERKGQSDRGKKVKE